MDFNPRLVNMLRSSEDTLCPYIWKTLPQLVAFKSLCSLAMATFCQVPELAQVMRLS